jgi:pimeloyl-ACP methyl ester carboxylesterase
MGETAVVRTSGGPVEIVRVPGDRSPVLFFPGGHCGASVDCGWRLYTGAGHSLVSFSRPGYGNTRVGPLSPAEFAPLVRDVCRELGLSVISAAVGVSFGGMQAVHAARDADLHVEHLVLHSCAPSGLPYPDTRSESLLGPVLFAPELQGIFWNGVRRVVDSDAGLRMMMGRLSRLPTRAWWHHLTPDDKAQARLLFRRMSSDSGFLNDLRHGRNRDAAARRDVMAAVRCPTLVTGSRHDRGVAFAHAEDFARHIPGAVLRELDSPNHIFWIGPDSARLASIVEDFLDG